MIYNHLVNKCELLCNLKDVVVLYPTALDMLQTIFGDKTRDMIRYYENYMSKEDYPNSKYYNDGIQYSILPYTKMRLFGLATSPKVSVTIEGQSYKEFTHTVFHEIGHLLYGDSEKIANEFAILKNKELWND